MRWRLEEIARREERRGRKVWVGYGKIRIHEQWWRWDKGEEVLRDVRGRIWDWGRGEGAGEEKRGKFKGEEGGRDRG